MKRFIFLSLCALMTCLTFGQSGIQTIYLPQGWSMFSTYIQPSSANISNVMSPVVSQILIVKDGDGNVFWPQYGVNLVGNMQNGKAYEVKMNTAQNLIIAGLQLVPENNPLILPQGWSMIGYLRTSPSRVDSTFSHVVNNVHIIKDDNGSVYWPLQDVNQILFIRPGKGYQIRMLNADTLNYLSSAFHCGTDVITDFDGNTYNTVQIGSQCWMKENLATTHYSDGSALVDGTNAGAIIGNYTTKYWFVFNNNISFKETFGLLYTWAAIMNGSASSAANPSDVQGICPAGWHVPSDAEWKQMEMFLGMSHSQADSTGWRGTTEGGKLKEAGTTHWTSPNTGAVNSSGFTALPGGIRYEFDIDLFYYIDSLGYWWTTTGNNASGALVRHLRYNNAQAYRDYYEKTIGFSVRCLMDTLPSVTTSGISGITQPTATCGGNVTADGGATVTARGVCWNTAGNPTIADSHSNNGSGIGVYTSSLFGLSANTTYYVRAYATNMIGTSYGNEVVFTIPATELIPDGYGSYSSTITFSSFLPGQMLTNINQLTGICAVMEHSFLGDLEMTLTCPNGTTVDLKHFPGGCTGNYMGIPVDDDTNLAPGTGWEYCWTPNPTYGTMNAECANYSTLPSGSYATYSPVSDLIGCPLNGDWTFTVIDVWTSDNGYVFGWSLDLYPTGN
ncbi:MAG: hypothetical protein NTW49_03070 [Bacteroidia bacterium]|nr:hypothetical protein [Bacteroidia bacterium]